MPPTRSCFVRVPFPARFLFGLTLLLVCSGRSLRGSDTSAGAEEPLAEPEMERGFPYTTREERREAGREVEITDWLSIRNLLEVEANGDRYGYLENHPATDHSEFVGTLQTALMATPAEWLTGEVIIEYDSEVGGFLIDEALVEISLGDWEFEFGDLFVNFGEYFSHFANGPILEFAETRGDLGGIVSRKVGELLDMSAFVYEGRAGKVDESRRDLDWGLAFEASIAEVGTVGFSYISDLADAEADLLEDFDRYYTEKVPAISGYLVAGFGDFELTTEFVMALQGYRELESDRNQPLAWNLELAGFPAADFSWAIRIEGSEELEDEPAWQAGASVTFRLANPVFLTVEYLYGRFEQGFAEGRDAAPIQYRHRIGILLIIEL